MINKGYVLEISKWLVMLDPRSLQFCTACQYNLSIPHNTSRIYVHYSVRSMAISKLFESVIKKPNVYKNPNIEHVPGNMNLLPF